MALSTEELLKPRFKVTALYPQSPFIVGEVLTGKKNFNGNWFFSTCAMNVSLSEKDLQTYPHLFRKLTWWQYRDFNDLPKYLKHADRKIVAKVKEWALLDNCVTLEDDSYVLINHWEPATLAEYNEFKSKQK